MRSKPAVQKPSPRGRPFDADGNITREKIIDGGRECFAQYGYSHSTNKMIAEAAGVTASAIYNYFPSKAEIYFAVMEQGENHIAAIYEKTIHGIDSPLQALLAILDMNITLHGHKAELSPFFGHVRSEISRHPELAEYTTKRHSRTELIFRNLIVKAQAAGELTNDIPARNIEMMLFACILGLSVYGLQVDTEEHRQNMVAFRHMVDGSLVNQSGKQ